MKWFARGGELSSGKVEVDSRRMEYFGKRNQSRGTVLTAFALGFFLALGMRSTRGPQDLVLYLLIVSVLAKSILVVVYVRRQPKEENDSKEGKIHVQ